MAEYRVQIEPGALTIRPGWLLRAIVYGLAVLGGSFLLLTVLVLVASGLVPGLLLTLGFGLGFSGSAFGILFGRDLPSAVRADANGLHVTAQRGGGRALVPSDAIAEVMCLSSESVAMSSRDVSTTQSHRVLVRKKDGGLLELYRSSRAESAQQVAAELRRLFAQAVSAPGPSSSTFSSAVTVTRAGDGPRFAWRAGTPLPSAVFAWGISGGVLCGSTLFAIEQGGAAFLAVIFVLLLIAALTVKFARDRGVTQSVAIVGDELRIERRRGAELLESKSCPLRTVQAVDYTMRLDRVSPLLAIRTGAGQVAVAILEVAAGTDDLAKIGSAMSDIAKTTLFVPVERLTLADRITLDQELSREVAERRGTPAANV